MRMPARRYVAVACTALSLALAAAGTAAADTLTADTDSLATGTGNHGNGFEGPQDAGTTVSYPFSATVKDNNKTDDDVFANPGDTVDVAVTFTSSQPGWGVSVDSGFAGTADFDDYNQNRVGQLTVTVPAGADGVTNHIQLELVPTASNGEDMNNRVVLNFTITAEDGTVVVGDPDGDGDGIPDAQDNCIDEPNPGQEDADNDLVGDVCDENAFAPVVSDEAEDASGDEGSTLSTSGAFTDGDGNGTLTISKVSGAGTVTDNLDGTWSWSFTPDDEGTGPVVVSAYDGEHPAVTDSFDWTAVNVPPSVGAPVVTATGACSVSISANFTDPGTTDTHTASIAWGDGAEEAAPAPSSGGAGTVSGTHTYASAGTMAIGVTVTDNDGGVGSSGATSFATKNTPSKILQPINASGTRSSFKIGSTIPVKIQVKDCAGNQVKDLAPKVSLTKLDSNAETGVNEVASTVPPTSGTTMRWDGTSQYIYNLSTKNSQFAAGQPLTAGTYRVTVSDPSFFAPTSAVFDVKK